MPYQPPAAPAAAAVPSVPGKVAVQTVDAKVKTRLSFEGGFNPVDGLIKIIQVVRPPALRPSGRDAADACAYSPGHL